jgi:hypothetical protein
MYESSPESTDHHDGRNATNEETARVVSERSWRDSETSSSATWCGISEHRI